MTPRQTSRFERAEADWYLEPRWTVDLLLDAEPINGVVYDPACGSGNIVRACLERGMLAYGSDLHDRGFGCPDVDFIGPQFQAIRPAAIISNPPFSLFEQFVEQALRLVAHKVCMLARLAVLEGMARHQALWEPNPPTRVWVLSKRASMPPGDRPDIKPTGGQAAYCWLVWDVGGRTGPTQLGWLCPEKEAA